MSFIEGRALAVRESKIIYVHEIDFVESVNMGAKS